MAPTTASSESVFAFTQPRGVLDWRSGESLGVDPEALLTPGGVSEVQLSQLTHCAAVLRYTRLEADPRLDEGANTQRFLRVAQLLQLAAQWQDSVSQRDVEEAYEQLEEVKTQLAQLQRTNLGTAALRHELLSERMAREGAEARAEAAERLAASSSGEEAATTANAALAASLRDGEALESALRCARSEASAAAEQASAAVAELAAVRAQASARAEALEQQLLSWQSRAEEAERQAESARAAPAQQELSSARNALAASRAEAAGLADELACMRAAAGAAGRDSDLVADASSAHAKCTLLLVREARLVRQLDVAADTEAALRRQLAEQGAQPDASQSRALAHIDEIRRLRLAHEELEARLSRKAEALAEATAEGASACAERDAALARLQQLMADCGGSSAQHSAQESEEEAIARVTAAAHATISRLQRACNEKDALLARSAAASAQQRADSAAAAAAARAEVERLSDALMAANDASITGFKRALEHSGGGGAAHAGGAGPGVPLAAWAPAPAPPSSAASSGRHSFKGADELRALLVEREAQVALLRRSGADAAAAAADCAAAARREHARLRVELGELRSLTSVAVAEGALERLRGQLQDKEARVQHLRSSLAQLQEQLEQALAAQSAEGAQRVCVPAAWVSERDAAAAAAAAAAASAQEEALRQRKRADALAARVAKLSAQLGAAQGARATLEAEAQAQAAAARRPPRPPAAQPQHQDAVAAAVEEGARQRRRADALREKLSAAEAALAAATAKQLDNHSARSRVDAASTASAPPSQPQAQPLAMLRTLHEECEAAHARADAAAADATALRAQLARAERALHAAQARLAGLEASASFARTEAAVVALDTPSPSAASPERPRRASVGAFAPPAHRDDARTSSTPAAAPSPESGAALAARDENLAQLRSALEASGARSARLSARLDALFGVSAGAAAAAAAPLRGVRREGGAGGGSSDEATRAARAREARDAAALEAAKKAAERLRRENAAMLKAAQKSDAALTAALERAAAAEAQLQRAADGDAHRARTADLLAAAAEATARCDALEAALAAAEATVAASAASTVAARAVAAPPAPMPPPPPPVVPASPDLGALADLRCRMAALEASLQHSLAECARLEEENVDLRAELGALDPSFFDEIEALKLKAHRQGEVLGRYESLLRQYADALGLPFQATMLELTR